MPAPKAPSRRSRDVSDLLVAADFGHGVQSNSGIVSVNKTVLPRKFPKTDKVKY